ncbi:MAG: DUF4363 family protein [Clostridia bacterium]|nr:DUF4363 family protein [Clostridia bacterium]
MNRVVAAICILVLCGTFVGVHTYKIIRLNKDVTALCEEVEADFQKENWSGISGNLQKLRERWDKSRLWACLTIDTKEIEEIEISLKQSMKYAEVKAKPDFIGEFTLFRMRLEHIPHQEGFSMEEVL